MATYEILLGTADGTRTIKFDSDKIFQLPTFAEFNLPAAYDAEIISRLNVDACADSAEMEAQMELTKRLKSTAAEVVKELDTVARELEKAQHRYANLFLETEQDTYKKKYHDLRKATQECYAAISATTSLQKYLGEKIRDDEKRTAKKFLVEVGERLRTARRQKKLTQLQVAGMLGLTQKSYSAYETGYREMSPWTIRRLSEIFDISPNWLLNKD